MLELSNINLTESIRNVSEDPLVPHVRNCKAGAAVVLVLASFLFVFSYEWFRVESMYPLTRYDNCITYTMFSHIILTGVINERMDTQLHFMRRIRLKNILKFLGMSAVVIGIGVVYIIVKKNPVKWNIVTIRLSLMMMCFLSHTAVASNHYNIVDMMDQSLQRSSISMKNSIIDFRSKNKVSASELETVILNYKNLVKVRKWLTLRISIDVIAIFVLYLSLVMFYADAQKDPGYTILIFGFFLVLQSTSMYTVGQFNKRIHSLEHLNNVHTRLMVRISKWKPSEEVFMSSVFSILVILINVMFNRSK